MIGLIFCTAMIMGLPALRGGFVGGDDHRLVLNHVLVNRPSLSHAVELFRIVHRDLYQPLPLLSFQMEFAVGQKLGMFEDGIEGASWFFHFNNVWLHAINAVLVWFVVRMLHAGMVAKPSTIVRVSHNTSTNNPDISTDTVATIAALIFAVHPMQTEVVAWLNGRMMLMSTLFALASLLTFHQWLNIHSSTREKGRWKSWCLAIATLLLVLFCTISKVRIGLPIMLGIVLLTRSNLWDRKGLILWTICSIVVGVFVWVNVQATADAKLFSNAAEFLKGPRLVRVILAIDHYVRHFIWPVGLASFYHTPLEVYWSDRETWVASLVAIPVLIYWGFACFRYRMARWVALWFWSTIAATLPIIPARNILAADRYMYLPIIALSWMIAEGLVQSYHRWIMPMSRAWTRYGLMFVGSGLIVVMVGMSWHIASFYETPLKKTMRIAQVFPDVPHVWERLGWAYYKLQRYDKAIECANKELQQENDNARSAAYQLMGMTALKRGEAEQALAHLHHSIEIDTKNTWGIYRLAMAYDELGRFVESVHYYEQAVEAAPGHNPTMIRLARVYRTLNQLDDARAMYFKALVSNPYDYIATMGLVEFDLQRGSSESYRDAVKRLEDLLDWMPDHIDARVNLGVAYRALGQTEKAIEAYTNVLRENPYHVTAALNLAQLYLSVDRTQRVGELYDHARKGGLQSVNQALVVHDYYFEQGKLPQAVALWKEMKKRFPQNDAVHLYAAMSSALSGDLQQARYEFSAIRGDESLQSLRIAVDALLAILEKRFDDALSAVESLCAMQINATEARRRLLAAMKILDQHQPGIPWTYCLVSRLLIEQHQLDAARGFLQLCDQHCSDPHCQKYRQTLQMQIK